MRRPYPPGFPTTYIEYLLRINTVSSLTYAYLLQLAVNPSLALHSKSFRPKKFCTLSLPICREHPILGLDAALGYPVHPHVVALPRLPHRVYDGLIPALGIPIDRVLYLDLRLRGVWVPYQPG